MTDQGKWASALTPRGLQMRVSLLYAAVYLHYGVLGPFLPLWFSKHGIADAQVGILMSVPMFLRILFVAPVTGLADRLRRVREILFLCTAGTAVLMAGLGQVHGYIPLLIFFTVLSLVWDPLPVLADSYAVASVRSRGLDFGRMRVWGSLAFVLANIGGGWLVQQAGPGIVTWLICGLLVVPLLVIPLLPPDRLLGDPVAMAPGEWRILLKDRALLMNIVGASLILASGALIMGFSVIHWTQQGLSGTMTGLLWAVAIGSEVVALWVGQKLLAGRSPLLMIMVGGATAIVRWVLMAFDPPLALLFPLQLLQGATAMATIPGLMLFMAARAPIHLAASVQGLNAVIVGLIAAVVMMGSGFLWKQFGPTAYVFMALIAFAGLALVAFSYLRLRRGADPAPYPVSPEQAPAL